MTISISCVEMTSVVSRDGRLLYCCCCLKYFILTMACGQEEQKKYRHRDRKREIKINLTECSAKIVTMLAKSLSH